MSESGRCIVQPSTSPVPKDLNGDMEELSPFQNIPSPQKPKPSAKRKTAHEILSHSFLKQTMHFPANQGDRLERAGAHCHLEMTFLALKELLVSLWKGGDF